MQATGGAQENPKMEIEKMKKPELIERWIPRSHGVEEALKIATHETLHEIINEIFGLPNTVFTEALFDVLCGREECGLWFGKEAFIR